MRIFLAILFSLSLTVGAGAQHGSGGPSAVRSLSNAEAIRVISTEWNALVGWLMLGERIVTTDTPSADCKSERITAQEYDFLLNAERAGLVTLSYWDGRGEFLKERDYTNKERIEFALSGRLQKFTVQPTDDARKEQIKLEITGRTGCLTFKLGDYRIEQITENRPFRKGATELAAVTVLYHVTYRPIYEKIYKAGKVNISNRRKANVLLRFDPERERWHTIAFDAANADEEIKPVNIPAIYNRIR